MDQTRNIYERHNELKCVNASAVQKLHIYYVNIWQVFDLISMFNLQISALLTCKHKLQDCALRTEHSVNGVHKAYTFVGIEVRSIVLSVFISQNFLQYFIKATA